MVERQQHREDTPAYCVTIHDAPHQWRFSFTPADGAALARRVRQLADDPAAPLDADLAHVVLEQIARLANSANPPQIDAEIADLVLEPHWEPPARPAQPWKP